MRLVISEPSGFFSTVSQEPRVILYSTGKFFGRATLMDQVPSGALFIASPSAFHEPIAGSLPERKSLASGGVVAGGLTLKMMETLVALDWARVVAGMSVSAT